MSTTRLEIFCKENGYLIIVHYSLTDYHYVFQKFDDLMDFVHWLDVYKNLPPSMYFK